MNSVCHLYLVFWFLSVPVPLNSKDWLCVFFEIFVSDRGSMLWVKAFSSAAFTSISMVCLSTLINTVYAQWWIIQSHTSNRCQRIQNDFSWIIYYFQKSNRFVEQVIGNTNVDQGLSAGSKVYYCFSFLCRLLTRAALWKGVWLIALHRESFIHLACWLGSWNLVWLFRLSMDDKTWMGIHLKI